MANWQVKVRSAWLSGIEFPLLPHRRPTDCVRFNAGLGSISVTCRSTPYSSGSYRVRPCQVSGPAWIRNQRFDVVAKMPEGAAADRLPEMLQTLLADRFKLTIHPETKVQRVYALVTEKNGIKLERAAPDAGVQAAASPKARQMFTPDGDAHFDNARITIASGQFGPTRSLGSGKWEMLGITMPALAELLAPHEDDPVIDETNLPGAYRLVCEIAVKGR